MTEPDTFTLDVGQHVDAQGRVTYTFAGHIFAAGIDLPAGTSDSPPDDSRVRWLDAGGDEVGSAYVYELPGSRVIVLKVGACRLFLTENDAGASTLLVELDGEGSLIATGDGPGFIGAADPSQRAALEFVGDSGAGALDRHFDVTVAGAFVGSIPIDP